MEHGSFLAFSITNIFSVSFKADVIPKACTAPRAAFACQPDQAAGSQTPSIMSCRCAWSDRRSRGNKRPSWVPLPKGYLTVPEKVIYRRETIGNRTHILSERLKVGTELRRLKKGIDLRRCPKLSQLDTQRNTAPQLNKLRGRFIH